MAIREKIRTIKHLQNRYFLCVLEKPTHLVNVGSALRNICAFGVEKVYIIGGAKDVFRDFTLSRTNKHLTKVSVGTNKWVFVKYFETTADCIAYLRKNAYTIAVTSSHKKKKNVNLYEERFTQKRLAVWFGNETRGISDEAVANADLCIGIPMGGVVESLNLGTSTGIILSYIGYQRWKFIYSHNKAHFKSQGFAKLKMRSWQDFIGIQGGK